MAKIRLIATDMDGTLLNSKKQKPADFDEWVISHPDIITVIASGRQYFALKNDFKEIGSRLIFIAENGGLVYKNDEVIYSNEITADKIVKVLDIITKINTAEILLCGAKSAYMKHTDKYIEECAYMYYNHLEYVDNLYDVIDTDTIVKIAVFVRDEKAEEVCSALPAFPEGTKTMLSSISWFDVANEDEDKGKALRAVQNLYGISREESMAFGDYMNDYELLLQCEESYCMENGHPNLKKAAKHIAPSNDDDGVMQIIRKL